MRRLQKMLLGIGVAVLLGQVCAAAGAEKVAPQEAQRWTRCVIPLPHEILLPGKVRLPAQQVAIRVSPEAGLLEHAAASELIELFCRETGKRPVISTVRSAAAGLEIVLGICDKEGRLAGQVVPGAKRLFQVSCPEQAYRIVPLGDRELLLVGTRAQGVYYAANTLKQLLATAFSQSGGRTMVAIPLADVTDWPDLAERGLWGGSADKDIEWMAEQKLNLVESHVQLSVDSQGRGLAVIPDGLVARAQRHAVKLVPIITHLEQLPPVVFQRFPELRAVGDPKAWRRIGMVSPVCFSQPRAETLLADWFTALARYPEVTDVNVWLSENEIPCLCEKCKQVNPFVLQTKLTLRAWEAAKRVRPDLRLRILLTQGSYKSNDQVLTLVPREVGVTYYDGGRTYDSSRQPMIYPLLEKYAAGGRWLGCYPQLTASWRIVCPWSGPQFIKARMTEFAGKGLKCLCGYAAPDNCFYEFNVTAAAEWSWNAAGRSEREFAAAWATREGLSDPEKAADWAVTLGPVGWDVYGGRVPYYWVYGGLAGTIRVGHRPALGSGAFTYFPTPGHFDADLAACDRAMRLAQEVGAPALVEETRVIRGYVEMLKAFYQFGDAIAPGRKMTDAQRRQAADALATAQRASVQVTEGLVAWGAAVAPHLVATSRLTDTVSSAEQVMARASDIAAGLGVADPERPYRAHRIGEWKTEDFADGPAQTKTWDVTKLVSGTGRYRVDFQYDSGWNGARIKRILLVAGPASDASRREEVARDVHEGSTGHQPRNTVYSLEVNKHDAKQSYFLIADLVGPKPGAPPERAGCAGHATMRRMK